MKGKLLYLRHNGPEHILAFAPTRSGKGVGLVIPTLLTWTESVVVLDIKGENWALTAGWRKKYAKNICLKFDPAAIDGSVKFNPLSEIRLRTLHEVADVQNIVTMVVDPDGKGLNDHWAKTGHALLVGAVLHSLYVESKKGKMATLAGVADLLSDPEKPIEDIFQEMLDTPHRDDGSVHPVVARSARDMLNKAENERSGVLSTAMSFLTLFRDPIVAQNTAISEFAIDDLMDLDSPVSLYLVVRPNDIQRLKPLVRLLINQIISRRTEKMEFKDGRTVKHYKNRLLLLIDEFPSLGRLEIFESALAYIAGYGLKAYLIVQDLEQLFKAYTNNESIISNCHIRIAYAPNKYATAELLSKMLGQTTIVKKSVSVSQKKGGVLLAHKQQTESWQEVQRPLLTPDECMRLKGPEKGADGMVRKPGDMVIFVAGFPAIYGRQILYFMDAVFSERCNIEAPKRSDTVPKPGQDKFELRLI